MPGLESVALGVWVMAGGRNETQSQTGIAHFLEHMAFKGTRTRSAVNIAEAIEDVGGYINAYTCLLYTSPSPRDLSTSRMPSSA